MTSKIVIVDDHPLVATAIAGLVADIEGYEVVKILKNGLELKQYIIKESAQPDVILLDINLPIMNGFETMAWIKQNHPELKVIALTMNNDDESIIKMLRLGARSYIVKDTDTIELITALHNVMNKGFHYTDLISNKLVEIIANPEAPAIHSQFKDKELEFLKLSCSELTYKEIASCMNLSPKTIDGYREEMFAKLKVNTRVGLVMYCMKNNLF